MNYISILPVHWRLRFNEITNEACCCCDNLQNSDSGKIEYPFGAPIIAGGVCRYIGVLYSRSIRNHSGAGGGWRCRRLRRVHSLWVGIGFAPNFAGRIQADILDAGYAGAILVNSDSPTLPKAILREAVTAVRKGNNVVLSPAFDGGYTLIGLSRPQPQLFEKIPCSTSEVYRLTVKRANEIGLPVIDVPGWYDVDDATSFRMLEDEFDGIQPAFASPGVTAAHASATREFVRGRRPGLLMQA